MGTLTINIKVAVIAITIQNPEEPIAFVVLVGSAVVAVPNVPKWP